MNMFKKNGGFTLVELIVVIAILAILAAVAIPAYSGYIAKANDASVLSELTAIQTAAQSACSLEGVELVQINVNAAVKDESEPSNDEDAAIVITCSSADAKVVQAVQDNFESLYANDAEEVLTMLAKHSIYKAENGVVWFDGLDNKKEPDAEGKGGVDSDPQEVLGQPGWNLLVYPEPTTTPSGDAGSDDAGNQG